MREMPDLSRLSLGRKAAAMIRSMTGYGRREGQWSGGAVVVEVRAVNHRYYEVVTRLPRLLSGMEEDLKRAVQARCARGRIELTVSLGGARDTQKQLSLDRSLARQYHRLLLELQRELKLGGTIDVSLLAGFRELLVIDERVVADRRLIQLVKRLALAAVTDLDGMRRREGAALGKDIRGRLGTFGRVMREIQARTPLAVQDQFERMKQRVAKLLERAEADVNRLHQELAIYAERSDIAEELARLESHVEQFETGLGSREPVGRTLDFLLQEMGREVNTIGSKANDAVISSFVVQLKSELEKMREQVQNIE
jgi:uncharacterized protein (TIGR00255 family)